MLGQSGFMICLGCLITMGCLVLATARPPPLGGNGHQSLLYFNSPSRVAGESRTQFLNSNQPLFSIEFSSLNTLIINRSWSLNPKHFCLTFTLFFKSGETYTWSSRDGLKFGSLSNVGLLINCSNLKSSVIILTKFWFLCISKLRLVSPTTMVFFFKSMSGWMSCSISWHSWLLYKFMISMFSELILVIWQGC